MRRRRSGSTSATCATTWPVCIRWTRTSVGSPTGYGAGVSSTTRCVIYSSDQGFLPGEHGWFDKRLMFEESLRMPFVLSAIPAGSRPWAGRSTGIVSNVDMAQTILDAAGVESHRPHAGSQLLARSGRRSQEAPIRWRACTTGTGSTTTPSTRRRPTTATGPDRYKLIYYYNDGFGLPFTSFFSYPPEWELYDLDADPEELRNVHDDPAYAEVAERLKAAMWREQARLGDAPHPSQSVPTGCEDVPLAAMPELPRYRWLDPGGMNG